MISRCRASALLALAFTLLLVPPANAGKPEGAGGGGGKPRPSANPDIVYMSVGSMSLAGPAIRGITLATVLADSSDASLFKANSQRDMGSIAWSPDGAKFAWIENGAIMAAAPGGRATQLYPTESGDPAVWGSGLAWGPDGCGDGDSVIAFLADSPFSVRTLTIKGGLVTSDRTLLEFKMHCYHDDENVLVCTMANARAFAFSPRGQLLAFHGYDDDLSPGIWAASMCSTDPPALMLDNSNIGSTSRLAPVLSIDWSPSGKQLAMSVTVGPNRDYPWRDIKIANLIYSLNGSTESANFNSLVTVNLDEVFGAASSEHSPRWGPDTGGNCQRIAFSQSAGASDGSDMNGRRLFLLDVSSNGSSASCTLGSPFELNARNPRAIDWK